MSSFNFSLLPKKVTAVSTKYRVIKTQIPVPESLSFFDTLNKYEARAMHGQLPVVWDRAEGINVYDYWGNKWLDFTSTIFVANAGHGNSEIKKALCKTINKPLLHTYTYCSKERVDYLQYLIDNTPPQFEKAFLLSAGTEASECALKLMRLYGLNNKKKLGILSFSGNWHGRTMGAQLLSDNAYQKKWISYEDPNIYFLPFPYPWDNAVINNPGKFFERSIENLVSAYGIDPYTDLCGVMLETYQGWGALFYPKDFIIALSKFCKSNNILIAFDEMQSGFGRTGKLFGYMHYDIEPDLICCGKGASSSLPLSIVLGRGDIMDLPEKGEMSSTHSANPMSCSAGRANLEYIINNNLVDNAHALGNIFICELNKIKDRFSKYIKFVSGKGLVAALIFDIRYIHLCGVICEVAMQKGLLLVHTGRESIKLAPPLTINKEALLEGLSTLEEAIEECVTYDKE